MSAGGTPIALRTVHIYSWEMLEKAASKSKSSKEQRAWIKLVRRMCRSSSNMLASFGIIVPTTLFKVMAVRLNAPELNIATVWKRKTSYRLSRPVVPGGSPRFW